MLRVACFSFFLFLHHLFKLRLPCQEKNRIEPLAVLLRQSAVVVQVLFQIGECTLNLIVCVRHSLTVLRLIGEEIWKVEIQTVHRSP